MTLLQRILRSRVYDVADVSSLDRLKSLSRRLGRAVWLKREDLQPVFSFKLRGAYNKMSALSAAALRKGVIASSAGNHAQGVALAAKRLKTRATIVMPVTTPDIKIRAVEALGARVRLSGDTYNDAYDAARAVARRSGATFIHPYDDVDVIAGQGTVGMEILNQHPEPVEAVFVPVGGAGLIAGIAAYVKSVRPAVKVIGVEPVDADALSRSLRAGRRVRLQNVGQFADGVAVKEVGRETFRLCRRLVDDVILVDTDDICAAIKDVFEDTRAILEPAGALSVAGLKAYADRGRKDRGALIAVASGANMNFDRLRFVAERAEVGEHREAIFGVTIPERPGSFRAFCRLMGLTNITEFNYRFADASAAHVFVGVQTSGRADAARYLNRFRRAGLGAVDLTDNEMAKLHARHTVGGRAPHIRNERVFRFEFPERRGALMRFLNAMRGHWNISLFHYRNQGSDYARVLCGMQVPPSDEKRFRRFLDGLGYVYVEETRNPAYRLFLA